MQGKGALLALIAAVLVTTSKSCPPIISIPSSPSPAPRDICGREEKKGESDVKNCKTRLSAGVNKHCKLHDTKYCYLPGTVTPAHCGFAMAASMNRNFPDPCKLSEMDEKQSINSFCDACDPEKLEILLQSAQENNLLLKDVQGSIKGTVNFMKTEFDILGNNDKQLLQKAQENNYKMDNLMSLSKKLENQDQDILKDTKTLLQNAKDLDANDKKMIKTMEKQGRTLQEIMGSLSTIKGRLDKVDENQKKTLKAIYEQNAFMDGIKEDTENMLVKAAELLLGQKQIMDLITVTHKNQTNQLDKILLSIEKVHYQVKYGETIRNIKQAITKMNDLDRDDLGNILVNDDTYQFLVDYKKSVTKPDGMQAWLETLFGLLTGSGTNADQAKRKRAKTKAAKRELRRRSMEIAKNMYEMNPTLCDYGVYGGFIGLARRGLSLLEMVHAMDIEGAKSHIPKRFRERMTVDFAKAESLYHVQCGCGDGFQFEPRRQLGELVPSLGLGKKNREENFVALSRRPENQVERNKAALLLEVYNFDVNNETMAVLKKYWYEDIDFVKATLTLETLTKAGNQGAGGGLDVMGMLEKYHSISQCIDQKKNYDASTDTTTTSEKPTPGPTSTSTTTTTTTEEDKLRRQQL